jgi:hypothetical protein
MSGSEKTRSFFHLPIESNFFLKGQHNNTDYSQTNNANFITQQDTKGLRDAN